MKWVYRIVHGIFLARHNLKTFCNADLFFMQVFCGRYVNKHMLVHEANSGHKVALSMADLSVWCYACDSYLDNHVSHCIKR